MDTLKLLRYRQTTMTVPEMRRMLDLGKTEAYWLLRHRNIETVQIEGHLCIVKKSFDDWYDRQLRYRKTDGTPPGREIIANSYSVKELKKMLDVSDDTILMLIHRGKLETFPVDSHMRVPRECFENWYRGQDRYLLPEDRKRRRELLSDSYSMPDISRILGVHRNTVYDILSRPKYRGMFEYVEIGGQKRITVLSFEKWYDGQTRYTKREIPDDESFLDAEDICEIAALDEIPESEPAVAEPVPPVARINYRVEDVQTALGLPRNVVYDRIQTGRIQAFKLGRNWFIPAAEYKRITEGATVNGDNHSKEQ